MYETLFLLRWRVSSSKNDLFFQSCTAVRNQNRSAKKIVSSAIEILSFSLKHFFSQLRSLVALVLRWAWAISTLAQLLT